MGSCLQRMSRLSLAIQDGSDIVSHTILVQHVVRRKTVADTDIGKELKASVIDLEALLAAYREGTLVEQAAEK